MRAVNRQAGRQAGAWMDAWTVEPRHLVDEGGAAGAQPAGGPDPPSHQGHFARHGWPVGQRRIGVGGVRPDHLGELRGEKGSERV